MKEHHPCIIILLFLIIFHAASKTKEFKELQLIVQGFRSIGNIICMNLALAVNLTCGVGIWIYYLNNELVWIVNFYLFGIPMVANWMVHTKCLVQTIQLVTMVKSLVTKCLKVAKLFTIWIVKYYFTFQGIAWIMDHSANKLFWTKLYTLFFLRKVIRQSHTNVKSFCMQFEKKDVGNGGKLSGVRGSALLAEREGVNKSGRCSVLNLSSLYLWVVESWVFLIRDPGYTAPVWRIGPCSS